MPAKSTGGRSLLLDPVVLLSAMAVAYLGLLWVPLLPGFDSTQFFSGASIIGYVPGWKPVAIFVGGIALLAIPYWAVVRSVRWSSPRDYWAGTRMLQVIVGLYAAAVAANIMAFVLVGAVPLFDIVTRQSLSPKLVWMASWQITLVPALMLLLRNRVAGRLYWTAIVAASGMSLVLLALLGTRSLPLKLMVALAVAIGFLHRVRLVHLAEIVIGLAIVFVLIGALSKSQIYEGEGGVASATTRAVNQAYLDSVGMFFRLALIVDETDAAGAFGLYHGKLLGDTLLNIVPGVYRLYANYRIGELVAEHEVEYVEAWKNGGTSAGAIPVGPSEPPEPGEPGATPPPPERNIPPPPERNIDLGNLPVSQAPTIVGAAYADFGLLGVVLQMLILGALMGMLLQLGTKQPLLLALLAGVTGHAAAGLNLGMHGEQTLILLGISAVSSAVVWARADRSQTRPTI